jgi:alpha-ketoglutarate-dependent taurine dioxygenase
MNKPTMSIQELPPVFTGESAWLGIDMASQQDRWLYTLTDQDIHDLETAAQAYLSLNEDIGEISKASFPLTVFNKHLEKLKEKLLRGCGVEVLRGLPIKNYSQEMIATVFCGIGAHLGAARSQNAQGHILGHVKDLGADANDPNSRIYQTNERQTFHTDSADVVGLLCVNAAKQGGESLLVSAESIYNRMRTDFPELLTALFDSIATDRRGEIPDGAKPFMEIPVFNWHAEFLTIFYQRQYIDSAQRFPDAMRLTDIHVQALDKLDELANDSTLHFGMQLEPGDMQFVYNHNQLHDRTGFLDWPEKNKRRHMLRLWLSMQNDRPLPECFKQRYGSIEIGNRGGIIMKGTKLNAPLS